MNKLAIQKHEYISPRSSLSDVANVMNRKFNTKRFFLYRHRQAGTFVLSFWLHEPHRHDPITYGELFGELAVAKPNPTTNSVHWDIEQLMYRWRSKFTGVEDILRALRSDENAELSQMQDAAREERDMIHSVKQRKAI